jgi:GNAT superfamily N-acetyltransferase
MEPLSGLVVRREEDAAVMAALQGRPEAEMTRRFEAGHRAYVASRDGAPAAWGWVATRAADIGELGSSFAIPAGERYLWNFVTLPAHRGLGVYPRLLEAIVRAESREAERFWIAYAPENHASGAGIRKAGFVALAELSFDAAGRAALPGLVPAAAASRHASSGCRRRRRSSRSAGAACARAAAACRARRRSAVAITKCRSPAARPDGPAAASRPRGTSPTQPGFPWTPAS